MMTTISRISPIAVLLTTLLFLPLTTAGANAAHATHASETYAPVKERVCTDCKFAVPPEMIPKRGVVISNGSFSTPLGYWETVDFDGGKLTRFITQINPSSHQLTITQRRSVDLSQDDIASIVVLANAVWRSPNKLSAVAAKDVVWGIDLFDGTAARKEYGPGVLLQGEGADLKNGVAQIWQRLAR